MSIKSIQLRNFTVFNELSIELSSGVNVFIGENGTGKTHILKVLYAFCNHEQEGADDNAPILHSAFDYWLKAYFQDVSYSKLFHRSFTDINTLIQNAPISISVGAQDEIYDFSIVDYNHDYRKHGIFGDSKAKKRTPSVYIPAKEMLTHSGFEKDFLERNFPFDATLIDILNKAGMSTLKSLSSDMQKLLDEIVKIIGGRVIYQSDRYYIDKGQGVLVEFRAEAEGHKKLGLLYRLIETGNIKKGSVLLWDEPEANMNPKLMPIVSKILLELSRSGVQVFIATHDYNLMKYFSIAKKAEDNVIFFSLYKPENKSYVLCEHEDDYDTLTNNAIIDAEIRLLEDEIEGV
ncbi:MAG: AAA family ATPase [Oscillospiraceae bacterium]|nr:AAA family ATPase [Oscillospiraceae bacterium]MCL2279297.1 AAA family ATPase [Oscillospiraceae bacterium]